MIGEEQLMPIKANLGKPRDAKPSGPRFLPDAACDAFKDPKIAGLPQLQALELLPPRWQVV